MGEAAVLKVSLARPRERSAAGQAFDARGARGVPTGVCACGEDLVVADAWNHRVLIWHRAPRGSHAAADVARGQADLHGGPINRGADRPAANRLRWPDAPAIAGDTAIVVDSGNNRVLLRDLRR